MMAEIRGVKDTVCLRELLVYSIPRDYSKSCLWQTHQSIFSCTMRVETSEKKGLNSCITLRSIQKILQTNRSNLQKSAYLTTTYSNITCQSHFKSTTKSYSINNSNSWYTNCLNKETNIMLV